MISDIADRLVTEGDKLAAMPKPALFRTTNYASLFISALFLFKAWRVLQVEPDMRHIKSIANQQNGIK